MPMFRDHPTGVLLLICMLIQMLLRYLNVVGFKFNSSNFKVFMSLKIRKTFFSD